MSTCRSCQAEVVFVPSAKSGKPMILDAKAEKRVVIEVGKLVVSPGGTRQTARVVDVYTDHHATCPAAADWKGRTR